MKPMRESSNCGRSKSMTEAVKRKRERLKNTAGFIAKRGFGDDVVRTPFHFHEGSADVFPANANTKKLYAT